MHDPALITVHTKAILILNDYFELYAMGLIHKNLETVLNAA